MTDTTTTITVQMFVDFTVDEDGHLTVDFAPRTMDLDFFAFAQVGDRTIHDDEFGVAEPATDEEWDRIMAAQSRTRDALRDGNFTVNVAD